MMEKGIALIGSTTIDKIIQPEFRRFKIGGVTTYSGITYSRHGIATKVMTNVAARDREIIKRLQAEGISVCNGHTPATTHFIHYLNDDSKRQKIPQRAAFIRPKLVVENINAAGIVHLGPLHASDIGIQAVQVLNRFKRFIVLDAQGLTRSIKNKSVYLSVTEQISRFFAISQVVKANLEEYESIIGFFGMDLSDLMHQFEINEFIVTGGHRGGFVQRITGETYSYPAYRIKSTLDPTGAGDVFLAAYVISRFFNRRPVDDACKYAAKLAARQIEGNYIRPEDLCLTNSNTQAY